jgi:hypothetical protein
MRGCTLRIVKIKGSQLEAGEQLMLQPADIRIESPSEGATYSRDEYGVYQYSTYPRSSVLAGQERRVFLASFKTFAAARSAYPEAEVAFVYTCPCPVRWADTRVVCPRCGVRATAYEVPVDCGYRAPYLGHLSQEAE